ncbi:MAG: hypothetical protein ACLQDV_21985 [Candidatus Binataceae bacterium]
MNTAGQFVWQSPLAFSTMPPQYGAITFSGRCSPMDIKEIELAIALIMGLVGAVEAIIALKLFKRIAISAESIARTMRNDQSNR